eukprot:CAMPEP_0113897032 /NCGR_PEP_ID=MMETSP0780_2-20120614/18409_1 /TAXON_ID=652834 /ORGANISM="Palpitomonas bilix" /LENGTH=808 /DNA_ID=CAMNT_0000888361 /DNA_START=313 /DNA_END=2739 /DNA_ORIENTATION=+ /assembly_acc=CAM_ASM_000599
MPKRIVYVPVTVLHDVDSCCIGNKERLIAEKMRKHLIERLPHVLGQPTSSGENSSEAAPLNKGAPSKHLPSIRIIWEWKLYTSQTLKNKDVKNVRPLRSSCPNETSSASPLSLLPKLLRLPQITGLFGFIRELEDECSVTLYHRHGQYFPWKGSVQKRFSEKEAVAPTPSCKEANLALESMMEELEGISDFWKDPFSSGVISDNIQYGPHRMFHDQKHPFHSDEEEADEVTLDDKPQQRGYTSDVTNPLVVVISNSKKIARRAMELALFSFANVSLFYHGNLHIDELIKGTTMHFCQQKQNGTFVFPRSRWFASPLWQSLKLPSSQEKEEERAEAQGEKEGEGEGAGAGAGAGAEEYMGGRRPVVSSRHLFLSERIFSLSGKRPETVNVGTRRFAVTMEPKHIFVASVPSEGKQREMWGHSRDAHIRSRWHKMTRKLLALSTERTNRTKRKQVDPPALWSRQKTSQHPLSFSSVEHAGGTTGDLRFHGDRGPRKFPDAQEKTGADERLQQAAGSLVEKWARRVQRSGRQKDNSLIHTKEYARSMGHKAKQAKISPDTPLSFYEQSTFLPVSVHPTTARYSPPSGSRPSFFARDMPSSLSSSEESGNGESLFSSFPPFGLVSPSENREGDIDTLWREDGVSTEKGFPAIHWSPARSSSSFVFGKEDTEEGSEQRGSHASPLVVKLHGKSQRIDRGSSFELLSPAPPAVPVRAERAFVDDGNHADDENLSSWTVQQLKVWDQCASQRDLTMDEFRAMSSVQQMEYLYMFFDDIDTMAHHAHACASELRSWGKHLWSSVIGDEREKEEGKK